MHKILIVAGGWSDRRNISYVRKNVFACLKKNNFNVNFLDIKKNNIEQILQYQPDIIFNSLHGEFGEDGGLNSFARKIILRLLILAPLHLLYVLINVY